MSENTSTTTPDAGIQVLVEAVREATARAEEANRNRRAYQIRLSEAREAFDVAQEDLERAQQALLDAARNLPVNQ